MSLPSCPLCLSELFSNGETEDENMFCIAKECVFFARKTAVAALAEMAAKARALDSMMASADAVPPWTRTTACDIVRVIRMLTAEERAKAGLT